MRRKNTPLHNYWHRRVDGQIRHTMNYHPRWFNFKDGPEKEACINSLSKRIVGEIVVAIEGDTIFAAHDGNCGSANKIDDVSDMSSKEPGLAWISNWIRFFKFRRSK